MAASVTAGVSRLVVGTAVGLATLGGATLTFSASSSAALAVGPAQAVVAIDAGRGAAELALVRPGAESVLQQEIENLEAEVAALQQGSADIGGQIGSIGQSVDAFATALANAENALASNAVASAEAVAAVNGAVADNQAAIAQNAAASQDALNSADTAFQKLDEISSTLVDMEASSAGNTAALVEQGGAFADATEAISGRVTTLSETLDGNTSAVVEQIVSTVTQTEALASAQTQFTEAFGNSLATVNEQVVAQAEATSSVTTAITRFSNTVDGNTAAYLDTVTANAGANETLVTAVQGLTASYNQVVASVGLSFSAIASADSASDALFINLSSTLSANAASAAQTFTTLTNTAQSTAGFVTTLSAAYGQAAASYSSTLAALSTSQSSTITLVNNLQASFSTNFASLQQSLTLTANAQSATASAVSTLSTTVGSQSGSISTIQNSLNGVLQQYVLAVTEDGTTGGLSITGAQQASGEGGVVNIVLKASTITLEGNVIIPGTVNGSALDTASYGNLLTPKHDQIFQTAGLNQTLATPAGPSWAKVELWGAGSGGNSYCSGSAGGYCSGWIPINPAGDTITFNIGAGGAGGASTGASGAGGNSAVSVGGNVMMRAQGAGAVPANGTGSGTAGTGVQVSSSVVGFHPQPGGTGGMPFVGSIGTDSTGGATYSTISLPGATAWMGAVTMVGGTAGQSPGAGGASGHIDYDANGGGGQYPGYAGANGMMRISY